MNDGNAVTVYSENDNYESGHFQYPDGRVVVF